jgi:hypothetical protein
MRRARQSGFSLMEVLLATSILLGSLIVLGQLASVGRRHAQDAEGWTAAQLACQTKLNEIVAGVEPVQPVEEEVLLDAPGWVYSVEVEPAGRLGLTSLRVVVSEDPAVLEETGIERPLKRFALTRWISDPSRDQRTGPSLDPFSSSPFEDGLGDGFPDSFGEVGFDDYGLQ